MTESWVVVLRTGDRPDDTYVYGPLADKDVADRFAQFLTREVDPARAYRLRSPVGELLAFWHHNDAMAGPERPERWPPMPGHVWEDRDGDRWICTQTPHATPYLVCIANQADDAAEEIWRLYGPLTFVQHVVPNGEEPLF